MNIGDKKVVILGAGISGLAVAEKLSSQDYAVDVIEKSHQVGGICASFQHNNFVLDYGPHKFYTTIDGIYNDFFRITKGKYLKVKKVNGQ